MSRTAVTPATGARNAAVAPTSTTINGTLVTNGVTIAAANSDKLLIRVANSDTNPHNIIIRAGDTQYPAWASGQGDLTLAVAASSTVVITGSDSARFMQSDGSMHIDFSTGFTGTLETVAR